MDAFIRASPALRERLCRSRSAGSTRRISTAVTAMKPRTETSSQPPQVPSRDTGVVEDLCTRCCGRHPTCSCGSVEMGGWVGGQAEYVLVPYADWNLVKFADQDQATEKILDLAMINEATTRLGPRTR